MTNKARAVTVFLFICLMAIGPGLGFTREASPVWSEDAAKLKLFSPVTAVQECTKCEGKCKAWVEKCKDGSQYGCYKASACLCKCSLDAGGCGSSKQALEDCNEENEKRAKEVGVSSKQDSVPALRWRDWQLVGSCGGVDFLASISGNDGRNDVELKLKVDNKNTYAVRARVDAIVESAGGDKQSRDDVRSGRLNGRTAVDCGSAAGLCLGALFPATALQKEPTKIAKITLTKVEVANIDAPPAQASPQAYLEPFRNFPTKRCRDLSATFSGDSAPAFVRLTDRCVKGLPKWTKPECDDAVDEILKAYSRATAAADRNCIQEWRAYQKCYEVYAYDSKPARRRKCERPKCVVTEGEQLL